MPRTLRESISILSITLFFIAPFSLWIVAKAYEGEVIKPRIELKESMVSANHAIEELAILIHANIETDTKERAEIKKSIAVHEAADNATTSYMMQELADCKSDVKDCRRYLK